MSDLSIGPSLPLLCIEGTEWPGEGVSVGPSLPLLCIEGTEWPGEGVPVGPSLSLLCIEGTEWFGEGVSVGPSLENRTDPSDTTAGPVWDRGAVLRLGVQVPAARELQHGRPHHPGVVVRLRILPLHRRLRHGMYACMVCRRL
jgi:hypothetical protein